MDSTATTNKRAAEGRAPVIGLTGSIGSGKSMASRFFEELGAAVIDADILAREVVRPRSEGLRRVVELFGDAVLDPNGELKRKELGRIVFSDPRKRKLLEDALHPLIRERFATRLEEELSRNPPLVVYAVPLLFESGTPSPLLEKIVVVWAPRELVIDRIMARDASNRELAEKKLDAQLPIEEKRRRADYVLENDGSIEDLRTKVEALYELLVEKGA